MADFCKQCSIEIFGEDTGDLLGLCQEGETVADLCEGCGPTRVDPTGACIYHKQAGGTAKLCYLDANRPQNEKAEASDDANSGS